MAIRNAAFAAKLAELETNWGIHLPQDTSDFLPPAFAQDCNLAFDAQPGLVTTSNAGIPQYLTMWTDPDLIEVLLSPNKGAQILGEAKKGDWLTETATFPVVESTGEVSSYGDFSNNGSVGANVNFPQRQSYHYQTITKWGEKTLERMGLAKIGWAQQLNAASAKVLGKFQNKSYLFGVSGLQCYGILNDPNLSAPIQPGAKAFNTQAHGPWITAGVVTATPNEVYADIQSLYQQLVVQGGGTIDMEQPMKLVVPTVSQVALTSANNFGVNVATLLKANFPKLEIVTVPEYATATGNLVQLIAFDIEGQETGVCAFTEKMRAHPIVVGLSEFTQKKSQGTWGAIIKQPLGFAGMLGV